MKIFILFFVLVFITSCASINAKESYFEEKMQNINKSDGFNEEEAIVISKNYLIEQKLDKNYVIAKPKVEESGLHDKYWKVTFPATYGESMRRTGIFGAVGILKWWISIRIDQKTGEIISVGGPDL